jgi:hypothetical protein
MNTQQTGQIVGDYDVQFGGFDKLMPHRVREVLLVAAPYDSFLIAEDDRLTELVFSEYLDLNLRYAPRVTRVSTAAEALKRLENQEFDLIITMTQIGGTDAGDFARGVRSLKPRIPLVLLCFNTPDVLQLSDEDRRAFDHIFLWLGDPRIFMSIVKLVEDRMNIDHDIRLSNVQAVILIEDSVRFYSSYLPIIYAELMKQTQLVMAEGLNLSHKMLRMRARPKILMASSFEDAWALYQKYKKNLLGVITDVEFSRNGALDRRAGLEFCRRVKAELPDMPILVQSSEDKFAVEAASSGAAFINKLSPNILRDLQNFMLNYFGFGDFIARTENGKEVGRAADLQAFIKLLGTIPDESLAFHSNRNHFSKWLMARTEFEIAYYIRPRMVSEFQDVGGLRKYLIETIHQFVHKTQLGTVIRFDGRIFDPDSPFVKIGSGSLGGKARGLAFVNFLLSKSDFSSKFPNTAITVPNTAVLATDVFDFFLENNDLRRFARYEHDNAELCASFTKASLPQYALNDLRTLLDSIDGPVAVRSSSLLEDSRSQPFAGVYKTYMLANNHPDKEVRLKQLERAIKFVYASTYSSEAKSYLRFTTHIPDEEKMAVIVQRVAGRYHDNASRFYPLISGVVQSYNYYPVAPLQPDDGVAYLALGLGKTIMDGYRSLRFSPKYPRNLHQFSIIKDFLANAQCEFMAVDSTRGSEDDFGYSSEAAISSFGLDAAEADGALKYVGSTYSYENDTVYDGVSRPGARLISFAPVLGGEFLPLAEILQFLCGIGVEALGSHVEIEFAVNAPKTPGAPFEFSILQMRPMISRQANQRVTFDGMENARLLCESARTLGNGLTNTIADIIYVKPENFSPSQTPAIAAEIGEINEELRRAGRQYLMIGPGRWGSSDHFLGIPVKWSQISASRVIVETTLENFVVEPSYGTHFFHNVASLGIGYFTVNHLKHEGVIDWNWLAAQKPVKETEHLRHVRLEKPLDIRIDGSTGRGLIATGV